MVLNEYISDHVEAWVTQVFIQIAVATYTVHTPFLQSYTGNTNNVKWVEKAHWWNVWYPPCGRRDSLPTNKDDGVNKMSKVICKRVFMGTSGQWSMCIHEISHDCPHKVWKKHCRNTHTCTRDGSCDRLTFLDVQAMQGGLRWNHVSRYTYIRGMIV